jgi:hypothetical protein
MAIGIRMDLFVDSRILDSLANRESALPQGCCALGGSLTVPRLDSPHSHSPTRTIIYHPSAGRQPLIIIVITKAA